MVTRVTPAALRKRIAVAPICPPDPRSAARESAVRPLIPAQHKYVSWLPSTLSRAPQIPVGAALVGANTQIIVWSSYLPDFYTSKEGKGGTTWTGLVDLTTGNIPAGVRGRQMPQCSIDHG